MELRHLRYFLAVAEEQHFGRAAARLFVGQPSLSQQILQLERELGSRLFDRGPRGVRLTEAGTLLVPHARAAVERVTEAVEVLRRHAEGQTGRLTVGILAHGAAELTPPILGAMRAAHPEVAVRLVALGFSEVEAAVVEGSVAVALLRTPVSDERIDVLELGREPRSVMLSATHRLAEADRLSFAEIGDEPVVTSGADLPRRWQDFWSCVDERGAQPRSAGDPQDTARGTLLTVGSGLGVAIAPLSAARYFPDPSIRYVPLDGLSSTSFGVGSLRDSTDPLVWAFRQVADDVAARLIDLVPRGSRVASPMA